MSDPIVGFFDRRPRAYDIQLPLERHALRAAAALAQPLAGARVVDLATGTGALAAAVLARPGPVRSLTAVDASPRMLERARSRLGTAATLLLADARSVPLPDGSADVVTIGYLLHLLDPWARADAIAEALRPLRPGGRLVAVVHGSPTGRAGQAYRAAWALLARVASRAVVGGGPMADLASCLAAAGLEVEVSRRVPGIYWTQVVRARRPGRGRAQR